MGADTRRTPGRDSPGVLFGGARPTCAAFLPRPNRPALPLGRRNRARSSPACRADDYRPPSYQSGPMEEPAVGRDAADPVYGPYDQEAQHGFARGKALASVQSAALPGPGRYSAAERRRVLYGGTGSRGGPADAVSIPPLVCRATKTFRSLNISPPLHLSITRMR